MKRDLPESADSSRRTFLLASVGVLIAGCGERRTAMTLPGPVWTPRGGAPAHEPVPLPSPAVNTTPGPGGVISRTAWAKGRPVTASMNRMTPVTYITVHHDALAFHALDASTTAARIEAIRRYHRNDRGWGDIGYHYVVDRAGRVWEGRPVNYQGAHVGDHNEGNVGVMALGNFDEQSPTEAQVQGVQTQVKRLMAQFRVPVSRVRTHQEWAPTACPGRALQRYMVAARSNGALG